MTVSGFRASAIILAFARVFLRASLRFDFSRPPWDSELGSPIVGTFFCSPAISLLYFIVRPAAT
jgi:hypothetical protein